MKAVDISPLHFDASMTSHEARQCSAGYSNEAARPCGAAAPRNGDAHGARLRSEGAPRSLLTRSSPMRKTAKYVLITPGLGMFVTAQSMPRVVIAPTI